MTTAAEKRYMSKVAELGCVVCRNLGHGFTPALVHHAFYGAGKRDKHYLIIPLCNEHHRNDGKKGVSLHADPKAFYALYGSELKLLNQVIGEINER